jgi:hypothetical protein
MAVYPEGNPGASPIAVSTEVGKLRLIVNDTTGVPYDPVEAGFANYGYFSDAALETLLEQAAGDIMLAAGYAYRNISAILILQSRNIATDDLKIQTENRAREFRLLADSMIADANSNLAAFDYWALTGGSQDYDNSEFVPLTYFGNYGVV